MALEIPRIDAKTLDRDYDPRQIYQEAEYIQINCQIGLKRQECLNLLNPDLWAIAAD